MNGAEHYAEALRLLHAGDGDQSDDYDRARVHAALAVAATVGMEEAFGPSSEQVHKMRRDWAYLLCEHEWEVVEFANGPHDYCKRCCFTRRDAGVA